MKIESVRLLPYRLRLREPWPTVEGPITEREGVLIALEDSNGRIGLGDAAPLAGFGLETLGSCAAALRGAARRLTGLPEESYLEGAANLTHLAPVAAAPAARHAIDLALHDLAARAAGRSIGALLGGDAALEVVPVNAVVPRVAPERAATLAREALEAGARVLKLKVGGVALAEDLARVRSVREAAGGDVAIRLDANQAWGEEEALAAIAALRVYEIEYIEQPVAASNLRALARLRREGGVAVAADESVTDLRAARRVLDAGAADILVLKPMVLGGLHAARQVAALATERGVRIVVTSLVESAVGRTGALHLAASLGPAPHAHGLATGSALAEDVADAPRMERGMLRLPDGAGLGIAIDPSRWKDAALVEAA
ncbi:MAG TPA: o-succinylbenzoate synthase [Candidatus Binatia bacterium]|nr:o-succinylbenzoate synthase [Candidatus Binatia bacterium]